MFFKKRIEKIEDPLFGSMRLIDDDTQYFGTSYFAPLKKEIEINIFSKSGGPTEKQRLHFKDIERRYFECIEKLPLLIEEELRKERKAFNIRDFSKEFELTGITISYADEANISWDLAFRTPNVSDGWVEVLFNNWEPKAASFVQ